MAGTRGSKYYNVFLNYKIWLSTYKGEGILGDGKIMLLKAIDREGSLMKATELLKISYRKAWGNIKEAEELLGFNLVEKYRGGGSGGRTLLSPEGKALVDAYDQLQEDIQKSVDEHSKKFFKILNQESDS